MLFDLLPLPNASNDRVASKIAPTAAVWGKKPLWGYAGKNMAKTVPLWPGCVRLLTCSRPACSCTTSLTSDNPMPLPSGFVEKNLSKTLGSTERDMPQPVSAMVTRSPRRFPPVHS